MSQRAVESLLGRLITDAEFRGRFFAHPVEAGQEYDCTLTAREREALLRVDVAALIRVSVGLDPTIVRAASLEAARTEALPVRFAGRGGAVPAIVVPVEAPSERLESTSTFVRPRSGAADVGLAARAARLTATPRDEE